LPFLNDSSSGSSGSALESGAINDEHELLFLAADAKGEPSLKLWSAAIVALVGFEERNGLALP
jgi:hypothetical protein